MYPSGTGIEVAIGIGCQRRYIVALKFRVMVSTAFGSCSSGESEVDGGLT
jgi:hypothetical protein